MLRFAQPWMILGLFLVPAVYFLRRRLRDRFRVTLRYSHLAPLREVAATPRLRNFTLALRMVVLILGFLALARPQAGEREEEILTEGVDIVLAIDISGSMAAEDFRPHNRLHVAKEVVEVFIEGRRNDRMGIVVFADHSYTKCPLTLDYDILTSLLDDIRLAPQGEDGTAIGMGLATAVNRLRESTVESRVVILLTDGRNNRGQIDPTTAAEVAGSLGVRVHTIGVGTHGVAPFPVEDPQLGRRYVHLPVDLDEDTLKAIADTTGGTYFRATDTESLESVFQKIDDMEKTEIQAREYYRYSELFPFLLLPAGFLLGVELLFGKVLFPRFP